MATITQSIEINRPARDVEQIYTNWTEYPKFIPFINDVQPRDEDSFECQLRIAGMQFSYTADVRRLAENKYAWQTIRGDISHQGTAVIESIGAERTRLTMVVSYDMPGPQIVGQVSNWLGLADSGLNSSLHNFKAYAESL